MTVTEPKQGVQTVITKATRGKFYTDGKTPDERKQWQLNWNWKRGKHTRMDHHYHHHQKKKTTTTTTTTTTTSKQEQQQQQQQQHEK